MKFDFLVFFSLLFGVAGCQQKTADEQITPSGYQYILHTNANGQAAKPGDYVYFHAQTRNGDAVINSSRESGNGVIPFLQFKESSTGQQQISPVQELLKIMRVGDSATIFLPLDTLSEAQKPAGFKEANLMLYDLVMLEVKSPEAFRQDQEQKLLEAAEKSKGLMGRSDEIKKLILEDLNLYKEGVLKDHIIKTENGVEMFFHNKTDGPLPQKGSRIKVNYLGALMDGFVFENSFEKGQPFEFILGEGRVIPGWEEALLRIPEHAAVTIFVPHEAAYGASGEPSKKVPEKADLIFYIELDNINL
jgi:FKBP-type peptidyl-prolyl cis-trans isomerase FkpA